MSQSDKLLFAVLKDIPTDLEQLNLDDFHKELKNMGIDQDSEQYNFLFSNNLLSIHESSFLPIGPPVKNLFNLDETIDSFQFKVKIGQKTKYVYLTDAGKILLGLLQSEYLKNKFNEL